MIKGKLLDILELQRGFDLPHHQRIAGRVPIISSSGISGRHNESKCSGENVITGRYGTIGEVYYYDGECWPLNTALFVKDFKGNYPLYIYYLLSYILKGLNVDGRDKSAVPGVDRKVLHQIKVSYHEDKREQHNVASLLSSIDNKISRNNRISAELEAMAKMLYDYWFVQFDFPDENGKPYRASGGEMVWNDELKREIPKGWAKGTIGDLGEIVSGGTPSTTIEDYYAHHGIAWITPNDLSRQTEKMFVSHGERDITLKGLNNSSAVLMPAQTVLLSSRAPIGYLAIAANELTTNQGFKSIVPCKGYGCFYIYYTLKSHMPFILQQGSGTTFKEVSKEALASIVTVLPNRKIVREFEEVLNAIGNKRKNIEEQSRELAKLRDWLLPMLMNGQAWIEEDN